MAKLKKKLALKEQGWHGNSLCLMSSDSTFELDKIEKAVNDCLSKEYMMVLDNQVDICQQIVLVNEQGNYDIYTNDDPSQTSVEMKTKVATLNKDDPLIKNLFIVKTTHSFIEKETSELGFVDDVTNDFGSVRLIVKKNRFDEIGAAMLQVTDCIGSTIVPIYFANENEKQKYFDAIDLTTENLMTLEEAYLVVAAEKEVQLRQNPRFQAMMLAIKGREA